MISTGFNYLDKLTGGLKLGDNVVWQISNAVPVEYFIKAFFVESSGFDKSIIYINFNYSPHTICKRYDELFKSQKVILIDAFTHGKGNSDPVFLDFYNGDTGYDLSNIQCIKNPRDIKSFLRILNQVQINNSEGCFYIFDSLTGMNELWKDETAVLDFFTFTCPKLYDLNTLAYWSLQKNAHSKEFLAGISHITQVVFSLYKSSSDFYGLEIEKLEDRPTSDNNGPHLFKILNKRIQFLDKKTEDLFKIGEKVKELRKNMDITQAELASSLGMTPGAVSQIENSIIAPSLQTLVQLSSIFNKPVEYFIKSNGDRDKQKGYSINRKSFKTDIKSKNLNITKLFEDNLLKIKPYIIRLAGGKNIDGPVILHKGTELIIITEGSMNVRIEGEDQELGKGDSLLLSTSFIETWENKATEDCEFIYILL